VTKHSVTALTGAVPECRAILCDALKPQRVFAATRSCNEDARDKVTTSVSEDTGLSLRIFCGYTSIKTKRIDFKVVCFGFSSYRGVAVGMSHSFEV
jgi:hypothetical protein